MAEIREVEKSVPESYIIYPYKKIDKRFWATYINKEGKEVPYSDFWRVVGFQVPFPDIHKLHIIRNLKSGLSIADQAARIDAKDPERLANFFCYQLIQGVIGLEDNGAPIDYRIQKWKDWLYAQFSKSSFLTNNFRIEYEELGGSFVKEEQEQDANFLAQSGDTSTQATPVSEQ